MEVGLPFASYSMLRGGEARENLRITTDIFNALPSPKLDLVALNLGAALCVCEQAESLKEGFFKAKEIIESKEVFKVLEGFQHISNLRLKEL